MGQKLPENAKNGPEMARGAIFSDFQRFSLAMLRCDDRVSSVSSATSGQKQLLHIPGADDREHLRSSAARRVAELAADSDLFFFNYEYRQALALPPWMAPPEELPRFEAGVLPELKYQAFRHDLLIGSWNPVHRAKWTAHELCHLLVGFAYRPNVPPGFHAIAAWLAELLPVALYYFFDEIDLRRCARHQGGGPLYRQFCADCERAALDGPAQQRDERFEREGRRFVDKELAAIERSRKSGEIIGERFGSIDLASDAIAYAAAHKARLESESFERFASEFFSAEAGLHHDLDALSARLLAVMEAISSGAPLKPLGGDRYERIAQDLGYRFLLILEETEGEAAAELDKIVSSLSAERREGGIVKALAAYEALSFDYELPDAEAVFGVGYALPGERGFALDQVAEGIASTSTSALEALEGMGHDLDEHLYGFVSEGPTIRAPIGRRFAIYLSEKGLEPAASHARLEAALVHSLPPLPEGELFAVRLRDGSPSDEIVRLSPSAELIRSEYALEAEVSPEAVPKEPRAYLIKRMDDGEVALMVIDLELADAIEAGRALNAEAIPLELLELGFFISDERGPILL